MRSLDELASFSAFNSRIFECEYAIPIQVSTSDPVYPPGFGPYINTSNTAGTSLVNPIKPSMMNNTLFMPTVQTNTIPQPTLVQQSNDDPIHKDQYGQGHAPKLTLNVPNSYQH